MAAISLYHEITSTYHDPNSSLTYYLKKGEQKYATKIHNCYFKKKK